MKRLLTLTFCLLTTGSAFNVLADQCDNLRNNDQAYRDCVNDWYGRSNRGSAPTPWWKNYDPNAGSGSAPYEAPTPSKQQLLDLQRQQQEAERQAAEEQRKREYAKWEFDHARGRLDWLNQYGLEKLKREDVLPAFNGGLEYLKKYGEDAFGMERACRLYENTGHAIVRLGYEEMMGLAEQMFKKSVTLNDNYVRKHGEVSDIGNYNRSLNALATFYERQGRLKEAFDIQYHRRDNTLRSVQIGDPELIKAGKDLNRVEHKLLRSQTRELKQKGLALYNAAQYAEAVTEFRAVLKLEEKMNYNPLRETDEWDAAHYNLGMSLMALKNYAEAESMLKAALAIREKYDDLKPTLMDYGPREISLRNRLNALANLYYDQQQYPQADPYLRRIVKLQEKTHAPVIETMKSLNSLALNIREQKRYDEAEAFYKRVLALAETSKDKDASEIATASRAHLADLQHQRAAEQTGDWKARWNSISDEAVELSAKGKTSSALEKAREALALAEKHDDPKQYVVASSQDLLAKILWRNKQTDEAESLLKAAISTYERSSESKVLTGLAKVMTTLANLHKYQDRNAEAELLYKRVIALREKQLEQNLPALIESLDNLAQYYFQRNHRSPDYAPLLRRLITLQEKQLGPEHLDVAETLETLAHHLYIEGMHSKNTAYYKEAETHFKRALAILEKSPSAKTKPKQLKALYGLRRVYSETNQEQAAELIKQREKALEEQS